MRHEKAHLLMRVVPVAMDDSINHGLADGHPNLHEIVFIEARPLRRAGSKFFGLIHAL